MADTPLTNSIDSIKNYFANHGGLQLANRFSVSFNLPASLGLGDSLKVLPAEFISLGPRSINTIQDGLQGYGNGRFVPRSQNQLSGGNGIIIVFPISNDNVVLDAFNKWFNTFYTGPRNAISTRNAYVLPYYYDVISPVVMTINILDPNGNVNSRFEFFETFPVETQPIELSMAFTDKYLRYAVTFGFREFKQTVL